MLSIQPQVICQPSISWLFRVSFMPYWSVSCCDEEKAVACLFAFTVTWEIMAPCNWKSPVISMPALLKP